MFGVHLWLAPAQESQRGPFSCRTKNYYILREPIVATHSVAVRGGGVQKPSAGVTISIFMQQSGDQPLLVNSVVSERALREIYLPRLKICVRSDSGGHHVIL